MDLIYMQIKRLSLLVSENLFVDTEITLNVVTGRGMASTIHSVAVVQGFTQTVPPIAPVNRFPNILCR